MYKITVTMLQTGKPVEYEAVSYHVDEQNIYMELPNGSAVIGLDTLDSNIQVREMEEVL